MNAWTPETLKQYCDRRFKDADDDLRRQHREYMRRLRELNYAHAQTRADQVQYISRDEFNQFSKRYEERHEQLLLAISNAEASRRSFRYTIWIAISLVGSLSGVAAIGTLVYYIAH